MLDIETYKKSLREKKSKLLSDEQLVERMDLQYKLAHAFFDVFKIKTKVVVVGSAVVSVHNKNGNAISIFEFAFTYAYGY